jgi:DNA-binding transcriptional MocR family regulator
VSRETVEAAYGELAARSVVDVIPGRGASVRETLPEPVELSLPFPESRARDPLPAEAWRSVSEEPEEIDFRGGSNVASHHTSAALRSFLRQSLEAKGSWLGPVPILGEPSLRQAASHVFASAGALLRWEEIAMFRSAEHALAALLDLFVPARGVVLSWGIPGPRMTRAVAQSGAKLVVIPADETMDAIRRRFARSSPRLLFVPSDHGIVPRRAAGIALRRELLDLTHAASTPVLEDASRAPGAPAKEDSILLSVLDRSGRVSSLFDFSDEIQGGFDGAALAVTAKALERLRSLRNSPWHPFDRLQQRVLALAIDSPLRARLQRAVFEKRMLLADSVKRGIRRRLAALSGHEFSEGMRSVRLDLPPGSSATAVQARAAHRGVKVWSSTDCGAPGDSFLLLQLTTQDEGELLEGIRLLGEALAETLSKPEPLSVRSPGPEAVPS